MKNIYVNFHQTELSSKSIKYFARFFIQYGTYRDRLKVNGHTISAEHCSIDMGSHVFESKGVVGNIKTPSAVWYKKLKKDTRIDRVTIEVTDKQYDVIRKDLQKWVGLGRYSILLDIFSEIEEWGIVPKFIKKFGVALMERQVNRDAVDMGPVIDKLRLIQQQQTAELSKLLNRNFEEWITLYGAK